MVALPLLLILFGIIEFGLVMFDKVTVVHDAREAARLAAVNDPSASSVNSNITFTCALDPSSGNSTPNVGDKIIAHDPFTYDFFTPLIGDLFGGSIDLSSNATMMLEDKPTNFC